jgi:hypothetical protein
MAAVVAQPALHDHGINPQTQVVPTAMLDVTSGSRRGHVRVTFTRARGLRAKVMAFSGQADTQSPQP